MHPPLTHTWPPGHCAPASADPQGATQRVSTHTAPPWHCEVCEQALGFTPQTPRLKSHAYPAGQGAALAPHVGRHTPSTQDSPPTTHRVPSEQSWPCAVQRPSMHLLPLPPTHCASALQRPPVVPASPDPASATALASTKVTIPASSVVTAASVSPAPEGRHCSTPPARVQTVPGAHAPQAPFVEASTV